MVTDPLTSPDTLERFHREARSVARLSHPGIVRILADGEVEGLRWFAVEHVDGPSLDTFLDRPSTEVDSEQQRDEITEVGSPGHVTTAVQIVAQIAEALAHAHENGIIHRDVKPSNVLLEDGQTVRLVDFGVARDEQFRHADPIRSHPRIAPYMSPEQARVAQQPVDERTDIYSAAVILYEMLGGRRPFEGSTSVEVLANLQANDPPQLERLNRAISRRSVARQCTGNRSTGMSRPAHWPKTCYVS